MYLSDMLRDVQCMVDAEGNKKAVQLDISLWEAIAAFIEKHEEEATEELLNIPGLADCRSGRAIPAADEIRAVCPL